MIAASAFSPDRKYRYALWRIWDERKPICMFIGLNPSTADENFDDPTIKRCKSYSGGWGYGGLCMANLFAYRSSNPRDLCSYREPIGSENDTWLTYLAAYSGIVVASWGNWGELLKRSEAVRKLIPGLYCLGTTKRGQPKHPLYLPGEAKIERYMP